MSGADAGFWCLSATAVLAGWRVFRTDSMVRASFLLLASFLAVGGVLLQLAASYLGFALFFMMAVEMTVMAVFMVMFMMNPAGLNPMSMVHQKAASIAAGVGLFLALAGVAVASRFPLPGARLGERPEDPIAALGSELLGPSMLVFESVGLTLLAAMIGSVALSSRPGRYGPSDEGSLPPALVPGGEPAGRRPSSDDDDGDGDEGGEEEQDA